VPRFCHGGIDFEFVDRGTGPTLLFQHGLGADAGQPADLVGALPVRLIAMSCRGHGETRPWHDELSIPLFAEDVAALARHLALMPTAVGGISMGAAIALWLAVRHPDLVQRLVLVRPAWLASARPPNLEVMLSVARLLRTSGPDGVNAFVRQPDYLDIATRSPDNATSLRRQFDVAEPAHRAALLERVVTSDPGVSNSELAAIRVPTLILCTDQDAMHPLALAEELAALLPQSRLRQVTSKSRDPMQHQRDVRREIADFLGLARHG
jgi:pimeloyl-ACP methyl ester carboxylesterase